MKAFYLCLGFLLVTFTALSGETLTGHVYTGAVGTTFPLGGVTVKLIYYPGASPVVLDTDVTTASGAYSLSSPNLAQWKLVYIVETDPAGYTSNGAQSAGGSVIDANTIRYTANQLAAGPLTDNNFWDSPPNTRPVAEAGGPYFGLVGHPITLDGSGSYDPDPGDHITEWDWDLNGDDVYDDAVGEIVSHTWGAPFNGSVYLRVYDTHDSKDEDNALVVISEGWDYGDAPAPYATTLADNGASHAKGAVVLGALCDVESDGVPSASGLGDDVNASDDEDGILFSSMTLSPGEAVTVPFSATHILPAGLSKNVMLIGWVDYNHDGEWEASAGSEETVCSEHFTVIPGSTFSGSFTFTVPPAAVEGHTFARFRLYVPDDEPGGPAHFVDSKGFGRYGEVEDYFLNIVPAEERDYGDAPTPYQTLAADAGASHLIGPYSLGESIDAETDGQPSPSAMGDDGNGEDDEDGLTFSSIAFAPGDVIHAEARVFCGDPGELSNYVLAGWLDFDRSNTWDPDEHICGEIGPFTAGGFVTIPFTINVPIDAVLGHQAARFRLYAAPAGMQVQATPVGPTGYGEVEDYLFNCTGQRQFDFGDAPAPYPTMAADGGAFHQISPTCRLGNIIDPEADGQPAPHAFGDDTAGAADEDGVAFASLSYSPGGFIDAKIVVTSSAPVDVDVYSYAAVWIDFNHDSMWDAAELFEHGAVINLAGTSLYTWMLHVDVPPDAAIGHTYMRARLFIVDRPDETVDLTSVGDGGRGEVEDYFLNCIQMNGNDFGDAPIGYPPASHPLGGPWLGDFGDEPDADPGMQWNMVALGDDNMDGHDDENGLLGYSLSPGHFSFLLLTLVPFVGHTAEQVTLSAWIDFNRNSQFDEGLGEKVLQTVLNAADFPGIAAPGAISFMTPAFVTPGTLIARLRIQQGNGNMVMMPPNGAGAPGEVEDYMVQVTDGGEPADRIVAGIKFHDANGDAVWSAGEELLANWTFYLDVNNNSVRDAGEPFAVSNHFGLFAIINPPPGDYRLREEVQSGWERTLPAPDDFYAVHVTATGVFGPYFFGNKRIDSSPGDCLKWEQPPLMPLMDEYEWFNGRPVADLFGRNLLADDWYCYNSAPVTGVTWWGAYEGWDQKTPPLLAPSGFLVAIMDHSLADGWEHPGYGFYGWQIDRSEFTEELVDSLYTAGMSEPVSCFKYTFNIPDPSHWFYQQGDSTHYWICIAPIYDSTPVQNAWGWASREHYFHADAVRITDPVSPTGPVQINECEVIEPMLDLAFSLHTNDCYQQFDFGDAFSPGYRTLKYHNGAKHILRSNLHLGKAADAELDGNPSADAQGDDLLSTDDEDGITSNFILPTGELFIFTAAASASGHLYVWADYNRNGAFDDLAAELVYSGLVHYGLNVISSFVPPDAQIGETVVRFRFGSEHFLPPFGLALDGEVEDYTATIVAGETVFLPEHWVMPINTGSTATIVIPTAAHPGIAGDSLQWGDYIGAFNQQGRCCGFIKWQGQNVSLTAWGDNTQTTDVVEGFAPGEEIAYRVYSPSLQREFADIQVAYSVGNGIYAPDAFMVISQFNTSSAVNFNKSLHSGWNGFSYNITNEDHVIDEALQNISASILMMKDGLGNTWLPEYGINTLGALDFKKGYKVYMNQPQELSTSGDPVLASDLISLKSGWNLIGYPPQIPSDPALAYASLSGNLLLAKDMYGHSFIPDFGINTIGVLRPGEAYNLFMQTAVDYRYPVIVLSLEKSHKTVATPPTHFMFKTNTGENAVVILSTETALRYADGASLSVGDEIGVLTAEDICCGAVVWEGQNTAFAVWGDDGMTAEKDGFYAQDSLHFVLWSKAQNKEYRARAESEAPLTFQADQIYVLTALTGEFEVGLNAQFEIPTDFALKQNYPNPFNPVTRIEYDLPAEAHVRLLIFNMNSQLVETLVDAPQQPGCHQAVWNASRCSSGVYICRMIAGEFTATRKMLVIK